VRLPVADPTHDVGVAGAVARADHVQHRRVPVVAAAAEDAAGREKTLEPAQLAGYTYHCCTWSNQAACRRCGV
jgi:hypothetical protein